MTTQAFPQTRPPRMAVWKALLLWLPAALFGFLLPMSVLRTPDSDTPLKLAALLVWGLMSAFFFIMLLTGKTYRYRSILFILVAVMLPFYFIPDMIQTYGTVMLSDDMIYNSNAKFCPLTMPMFILPALLKRVVIFPGPIALGASWFLLWIGASLSIGRGWCSWNCIYGGWDELFSRLPKRAKIKKIDRRWLLLPFGLLLAIVLLSALTLEPFYCRWLCPFKTITEFEAPTSTAGIVALIIFPILFAGLVVVLPLLTRKRAQCSLFCPIGAFQSFFNKINIFEVRINPVDCSQCKRCIRDCPTFSLDETSLQSGKTLMSCTKCGQCVDQCPKAAITYHIKGTPIGVSPNVARVLFLYPAFFLLSTLGAGIITSGLYNILKWITTGSMI